jgi:imidazole glycerol phosphate synthase subunit HisF
MDGSNVRVIASLQILGDEAVKTKQFQSPQYLGDPTNILRILDQKGSQEIFLSDIGASKTKSPNYEFIRHLSEEVTVPLAYGGGLSENSNIKLLTSLGVERFVVNNSFFEANSFVRELSSQIGKSSVSLSLDIVNFEAESGNLELWSSLNSTVRRVKISALNEMVIASNVGEVIIRVVEFDGCSSKSVPEAYRSILEEFRKFAPDLLTLQILVGSGIDSEEQITNLSDINFLDGFVLGTMICRPQNSTGVLISFPKKFSIL